MSRQEVAKWSDAQGDAITSTNENLLVSAAAGSGKTSVLAERCAHLVCHAPPPHRCDVDELLVVTFTRAAAAEMRHRIEAALQERIKLTGDLRLSRQLALIDKAEISTLHSFAAKVVRRHFSLLGIDPGFRTLDEHEARLLRIDVAREVIEASFDADPDGRFQQLVECYSNSNDATLGEMVLRVDALLTSLAEPQEWIDASIGRIESAAQLPLTESTLGRSLLAAAAEQLQVWEERLLESCRQLRGFDDRFAAEAESLLASVRSWQGALRSPGGYDAMALEMRTWRESLANAPKAKRDAHGERCKRLLIPLREDMKSGWLTSAAKFTEAQWREDCARVAPFVRLLLDVVQRFQQSYASAKQALRSLDFSDLERLTLRVLCDDAAPGQMRPSPAARIYRRQFKHVLVDEYQDINELQDRILRLISHDGDTDLPPNLFCVGDVKQSIYRFRLADPMQFLARAESYQKDRSLGRLIPLSENFRSDPKLLDAVNLVFHRLMTRRAAEIEYDESHRLRPGRSVYEPAPLAVPVEFHLLAEASNGEPPGDDPDTGDDDDDLDSTDREAAFVAEAIRALTADHASPRFKFGEIAILLRSMKHKAEQYARVLRRHGVPVHADSSSGLFDSTEAQDILSLLRCMDNPQQDIPLAALLRSPIVRLEQPDDAMARIRLAYPLPIPFHHAVFAYADEQSDALAGRLKDILRTLVEWRTQADTRPLPAVLWKILLDTGYLDFCAALPDGEQRVAILLSLHDRTRQFSEFQRQGLRYFLDFLQNLEEDADLGMPSAVTEPGDVVRIMSVHRSKGLQYPVVVLPDLGKAMNNRDLNGSILIDRDAFVSPKACDLSRLARWPTLPFTLAHRSIASKLKAEELRVLYVAMTRARHKLILTGTIAKPDEKLQAWRERWFNHTAPLPADVVTGASNMLQWLGPALVSDPAASVPIHVHSEADLAKLAARAGPRSGPRGVDPGIRLLTPLKGVEPSPDALRALERLTWRHPLRAYSQVAAATAVTQLTKAGRSAGGGESPSVRDVVKFEVVLKPPRFVSGHTLISPTDVGVATHRVLQTIDLHCPPNRAGVDCEIERLRGSHLVSADDAASVDRDAVAWFFTTPLAQKLRRPDGEVFRELPMFSAAPATDPAVASLVSADPFDCVMLRGQIDVLVRTPPGLVVIDYKTDRVTDQTVTARAEFYRPQVEAYASEIASITGLPVVEKHLVFLAVRRVIRV